jgi:hypothetical protein
MEDEGIQELKDAIHSDGVQRRPGVSGVLV